MQEPRNNFDSQLQAYFGAIKHAIKQEHVEYLKTHPELRQILNDFLSSCLLEQPADVYEHARKYFAYFNHMKDKVKYKPLVITGCSGVGKGTIIDHLLQKYPDLFELSISYTTRAPRQGEMHGREYYFVSKEEFRKQIDKNVFLENGEIHGNCYGTHKGKLIDIMRRGKICVLDIDSVGGEKIHNNDIVCNYLFIDPPSIEALTARLRKRGTQTEEVIQKRMTNAEKEILRGKELTFYKHILNDDLKKCLQEVELFLRTEYPNAFKPV